MKFVPDLLVLLATTPLMAVVSNKVAAYLRNKFEKYGKVIKATGARAE